jgi:hypothetical protein
MKFGERQLILPDLQLPFEHPDALKFILQVKREFRIDGDNILCVGDEVDQYFGSMYGKDPDATHTATSEIRETKEKLRKWYAAFPNMLVAESNHGLRWAKKAVEAEIPSQMLRKYQEVLETPEGWRWARKWKIEPVGGKPYLLKHGLDCSGKTPYRGTAEISGISSVFGHLHSSAGLCHVKTEEKEVWAMNVGCLIDVDAYAFHYGKDDKFKPTLGCGVILDSGMTPIWIPFHLRS